jgi:hypothetical protein
MKFSGEMAMYGVLIAIILVLVLSRAISGYDLAPRDVQVKTKGAPGSIFDLPYKMECVPGPDKTTSPYSKSMTPGGVCGAQEFVRSQADYEILGGIGDSLLA